MNDEVRARWEHGLAEHAARHYRAASEDFAACYRLDPRREFLFAWAQATRLGGDCETAVALYRRYLQAAVSAKQADAARSQLAACEAELAARTRATQGTSSEIRPVIAAPRIEPAVPARDLPVRTDAQPRSPWYRDLWGDVLAGTGVAALAAGTLLYISSAHDASSNAPTYGAYAARFADAERARAVAIVALGTGSALVAAGVLHIILRDDPRGLPTAHTGVAVGGTHVGIHYMTTF
jgi:hypothetical protein